MTKKRGPLSSGGASNPNRRILTHLQRLVHLPEPRAAPPPSHVVYNRHRVAPSDATTAIRKTVPHRTPPRRFDGDQLQRIVPYSRSQPTIRPFPYAEKRWWRTLSSWASVVMVVCHECRKGRGGALAAVWAR